VLAKPLAGQSGHTLHRTGFFKEMACTRHDGQAVGGLKGSRSLRVDGKHLVIRPPNDEQRGLTHPCESHGRQIWSAAPSSGVSRSSKRLAKPMPCKPSATRRLRGLERLLPLPWAKSTIPRGCSGQSRVASSVTPWAVSCMASQDGAATILSAISLIAGSWQPNV
jgi:hypothetical protein